ncbi:hypothetical protein KDAU_14500 [Dictyobacter aurantiacus]|uniref:Uncharacterized protein n=1 Tax=Dictyobacter aurantiacus TaxID=1936993 RepID=A0A401ZB37_9CHLR|nr:hypothetical protein KDAU_14500 [Dictyobacter aurantiacus]
MYLTPVTTGVRERPHTRNRAGFVCWCMQGRISAPACTNTMDS